MNRDIIAAIEGGKTELWLHRSQQKGLVSGRFLFGHLKETGLVSRCAGLPDFEVIKAKGLPFWRTHFLEQIIVVGWGSSEIGRVPCLLVHEEEVVSLWLSLTNSPFSKRHRGLLRKEEFGKK